VLSRSGTILVAAPGAELRQSIVFALEADGFEVDAHDTLGSAIAALGASRSICLVVDENALGGHANGVGALRKVGLPVILLVDRMRTIPRLPRIKTLTKPLLGQRLIEMVRGASGEGGTAPTR
jgi:DNA-binding response OmpR family regulator